MMLRNRHNRLAVIIVLLFGFVLLYVGTDGFQAFTAERARTNSLIAQQPAFPNVTLEDSNERTYSFSEFAEKYVMITFIYTSCTDVCLQLEVNLAEVYDLIPEKYIGEDIVFLSISFDPMHDDPKTLDKYRSYFESDGETWRMARIPDQRELNQLLDEFGVIVIPEDNGHFTHNSAFYLVAPRGDLIDVMDYTETEKAAEKLVDILEKEAEE